jgi:hypothetical protein
MSRKGYFVVPAQAGTQESQVLLDARLRGHDVNPSFRKTIAIRSCHA